MNIYFMCGVFGITTAPVICRIMGCIGIDAKSSKHQNMAATVQYSLLNHILLQLRRCSISKLFSKRVSNSIASLCGFHFGFDDKHCIPVRMADHHQSDRITKYSLSLSVILCFLWLAQLVNCSL